jgi:hypothetical protein
MFFLFLCPHINSLRGEAFSLVHLSFHMSVSRVHISLLHLFRNLKYAFYIDIENLHVAMDHIFVIFFTLCYYLMFSLTVFKVAIYSKLFTTDVLQNSQKLIICRFLIKFKSILYFIFVR